MKKRSESEARNIALSFGFAPNLLSRYINKSSPWAGRWIKCGHWGSPTTGNLTAGVKCSVCSRKCSLSAEYNVAKILISKGHKPMWDEWPGKNGKLKVKCRNNHICSPTGNSIQSGQGPCLLCVNRDSKQAEESAKNKLIINGHTPLWNIWINNATKIKVMCKNGHESFTKGAIIQQDMLICKYCSRQYNQYYIVINKNINCVKPGIASSHTRMYAHRSNGFENYRTWHHKSSQLIQDVEQVVLKSLKNNNFIPIKGREYFDISALELIESTAKDFF